MKIGAYVNLRQLYQNSNAIIYYLCLFVLGIAKLLLVFAHRFNKFVISFICSCII